METGRHSSYAIPPFHGRLARPTVVDRIPHFPPPCNRVIMNSHSPDITCSQKINSFKYRFQIAKAIVKRAVSIIFRIFGKKVFTNQNSCGIISSAFKHMLMGACSSAGRAFGSHPRGREFESLQVHQMDIGRTPIILRAVLP